MFAAGIAVALLALALLAAPWGRLRDSGQRNAFGAACAALLVLWQMQFELASGLRLHLSGATVLTLIIGPWLAMIGLGFVAAASALTLDASSTPLADWALRFLGAGGFPVLLAWAVVRGLRRFAPAHPFVYIFGNGFFAAGLALAGGGALAGMLGLAAGRGDMATLLEGWLPALGLLAFAEAWLSGMIVTLLVVYRPHWLSSFDVSCYLAKRGG